MTLGPRASEKGQHSSCRGLVQMAPWLSFLWDQQGYCWEGQSRLLSWPGPAAPLPDAELALWAHPCCTCPPCHLVIVGWCHTGPLFLLTSWQLRPGTASPYPNPDSPGAREEAALPPHGRHVFLLLLDALELRWRHSMSKKKVWC